MSSFARPAPSRAVHRPASPLPLFHGRTALAPGPAAGSAMLLAGPAPRPIQQIVTQRPAGSSSRPGEHPPRSQPGRSVSTPWPWSACRTLCARRTAHGCRPVRRKTTGRRQRRRSRSIWWAHAHVSRSPLAVNELEKHKHQENSVMEIPVVTACTVEDCAGNGTTRAPLWPSPWATSRTRTAALASPPGPGAAARPPGTARGTGLRPHDGAGGQRCVGDAAVFANSRPPSAGPKDRTAACGRGRRLEKDTRTACTDSRGPGGRGEPGTRLWHFRTTGEVS